MLYFLNKNIANLFFFHNLGFSGLFISHSSLSVGVSFAIHSCNRIEVLNLYFLKVSYEFAYQ